MKRYLPGSLRREWLERDDAPIERPLAEIIATFLVAGPVMADGRRTREEQARREEQERQHRKQDRNRSRRFAEIAKTWDEVRIARRFLLALREADQAGEVVIEGTPVSEWLDWAERKLKAADPIEQGIAAIFEDIANLKYWTYHD